MFTNGFGTQLFVSDKENLMKHCRIHREKVIYPGSPNTARINKINREINFEKAEIALQMEAKKRAEEGQNPFSRKKCNHRMVTKTTRTLLQNIDDVFL